MCFECKIRPIILQCWQAWRDVVLERFAEKAPETPQSEWNCGGVGSRPLFPRVIHHGALVSG